MHPVYARRTGPGLGVLTACSPHDRIRLMLRTPYGLEVTEIRPLHLERLLQLQDAAYSLVDARHWYDPERRGH